MQAYRQDWIEQIESLSSTANQKHIDVVVDQAGWEEDLLVVLHAIHPPISWFSLFSDTPEEGLVRQAPMLLRINLDIWQHKAWLEELIQHAAPQSRLLVMVSPLPFEALAKVLQRLSQVQWGGLSGVLRFYDPRVLPQLLATVLDPEEKERFLRAALVWGWLDRDQHLVWQPGTYRADGLGLETPTPLTLTDEQYDRLGSISDAQKLLPLVCEQFPQSPREECFEKCYRLVLDATREHYFGDLELYVVEKLREL